MRPNPLPSLARIPRTLGAIAAVVAAIALCWAILAQLERFFVAEIRERSEATAVLAAEALSGMLERFEAFPILIAERPILRTLLEHPDNVTLLAQVNEMFAEDTRVLGASDVYLMDREGLTIAASSYNKTLSFVGRNFSYRPYFRDAANGGLGRFFALGTTSGERGYFYAAPVELDQQIIGVLAVKFTVEGFEAAWQGGESELVITDPNNVIFMSNRPEWHFKTLMPLDASAIERIERDRQYPLDLLVPLENQQNDRWGGEKIIEIKSEPSPYLHSQLPITEAGWTVNIFTPAAPAIGQARGALAVILLLGLVGVMIVLGIRQRRFLLLERIEAQKQQQDLLERRVAERTVDLNEANQQLRLEVQEHRATEAQLKTAQAELVQAGKLAALGQMSAAISHEFNQPLSAIKSYAANAVTFLDRERVGESRKNLGRISDMVDRMAAISQHLRSFARRPQEQQRPISLTSTLTEALGLVEFRLRQQEAEIDVSQPDAELWVIGGQVRIEQVFVNLLTNALDARSDQSHPKIVVRLDADDADISVSIRDFGPGLDDEVLSQAFDPFFTTKEPGKGLGLGLSISYNIVRDFGGQLTAANHAEGGAVFTVKLPRYHGGVATEQAAE
ncbi:MAG: ATP-binding protein [Pseudomonadota bacterium]